ASLQTFVFPIIGDRPIADVNVDDVLRVLGPIWNAKPATAGRVRGRIEAVVSYAKALKHRTGENPATWRGNLDALLPAPGKIVGKERRHFPALHWQEMPALMAELRNKEDSIPALALQFAILTAARTGEVRQMRWCEVEERIWTVPGEHTK